MNILDEIVAKGNINRVIEQLGNSIDEIEKNNPNRIDFLEPMKEAKNNLVYSVVILQELRNELKLYKSHTSNLMLNLQMRDIEIERLKSKNKELMELL